MKNEQKRSPWAALAALMMLALFSVSILWALLSGAGVYSRLTKQSRIHYDSRTAVQYIATKVRQAPSTDAVRAASFGGADALCITQSLDGANYITRIYCHNGYLMELFTIDEDGFSPEDGEKILPADNLSITCSDSLLIITLTDTQGAATQLKLSIRNGEVSQP